MSEAPVKVVYDVGLFRRPDGKFLVRRQNPWRVDSSVFGGITVDGLDESQGHAVMTLLSEISGEASRRAVQDERNRLAGALGLR